MTVADHTIRNQSSGLGWRHASPLKVQAASAIIRSAPAAAITEPPLEGVKVQAGVIRARRADRSRVSQYGDKSRGWTRSQRGPRRRAQVRVIHGGSPRSGFGENLARQSESYEDESTLYRISSNRYIKFDSIDVLVVSGLDSRTISILDLIRTFNSLCYSLLERRFKTNSFKYSFEKFQNQICRSQRSQQIVGGECLNVRPTVLGVQTISQKNLGNINQ